MPSSTGQACKHSTCHWPGRRCSCTTSRRRRGRRGRASAPSASSPAATACTCSPPPRAPSAAAARARPRARRGSRPTSARVRAQPPLSSAQRRGRGGRERASPSQESSSEGTARASRVVGMEHVHTTRTGTAAGHSTPPPSSSSLSKTQKSRRYHHHHHHHPAPRTSSPKPPPWRETRGDCRCEPVGRMRFRTFVPYDGERREGIAVANPLVECVFERLFRTTARDEKGLPLRTRWSNAFRTFVPYREEREQLIEPLDVAAHARRRRRDLRRAVRVDDRRDDARQSARRRGEAGGGGRTRARSDTSPCPAKESDPSLGQLSGSRVALPGASPSPPAANRGRVSHWNREAQRQEIPGTR